MANIEILISKQFDKNYKKLSSSIQKEVTKKLVLFKKNWQDPKLKTHKLSGSTSNIWAFRVNYSLRVIFTFEKDIIILVLDVGGHDSVYKK